MKARVEIETFVKVDSHYLLSNTLIEMNNLLFIISQAESEQDFREQMRKVRFRYLMFGFGGSHMWVK